MICAICDSQINKIPFNDRIRDGVIGSLTSKNIKIYECQNCTVQQLKDISSKPDYSSNQYKDSYQYQNFDSKPDQVILNHLKNSINSQKIKNLKILDVGAGSGEIIKFLSKNNETYAVEPNEFYKNHLNENDITTFDDLSMIPEHHSFDLIFSVNVIEHLEDPNEFITSIKLKLNDNGYGVIITPNRNDILMYFNLRSFKQYFYRTAHLFYFNKKSILTMIKRLNLKNPQISGYHKYGVDNLIKWVLGIKFRTKFLDKVYMKTIEKLLLSSHIIFKFQK